MLMVGLPSTTLDPATAAHLTAGGRSLILFGRNLATPQQVADLTAAAACAAGAPLLVAADHEPGRVARLEPVGVPPIPVEGDADGLRADSRRAGEAMRALGVNLDLAPVVDVVRDDNPVLAGRSLGSDPAQVVTRGGAVMGGLAEAGVLAVLKHFPGHGLSGTDPHHEVTVIDADLDTLVEVDLRPFRELLAAGAPAVMVGHPIYPALDPQRPAGLSPVVLDLLRSQLGFQGVVMGDALSMAGVRDGYSLGEAAVLGLQAGLDLLIVDRPGEVEATVSAIVAAVEDGRLGRARLAEAASRVRELAASAVSVSCR